MARALEAISDRELRTERQQAAESRDVKATLIAGQSQTTSFGGDGSRSLRANSVGGQTGELFVEDETTWVKRWSGTAWVYHSGVMIDAAVNRGAITPDDSDIGALAIETDTFKWWYVDATPTWIHLPLYDLPNVATGYQVDSKQIIGVRGAAVADASGGVTVDTEARAAINALLARARAHGLIAV